MLHVDSDFPSEMYYLCQTDYSSYVKTGQLKCWMDNPFDFICLIIPSLEMDFEDELYV